MATAQDRLELDTGTCRQSAVIFRTNDNVLKVLLWQDMIPVREDLYRMTELLEIGARIYQLPELIRRLIRGLQERLLQAAEANNFVDMIEIFFLYKPMYHTCLNTYFEGADECIVWKFYVQSCLEWRNNVVMGGCVERKYHPVDFLARCPPYHEETFAIDEGSEMRLKAVAEYLTFFGSEGKKFLGRAAKNYDTIDILSRITANRKKAEAEMAEREITDRVMTPVTKKELNDKKKGIESKFNLHITLVPFEDALITEGEFIERLERRRKGLNDYYSFAYSEDQTDVINNAIKEYFGREFQHLVDLNGEQTFPYNKETGKVLYSVDRVEESIRNNEIRQKPRVSYQTLEALSKAKKCRNRYANTMVENLFPDGHSSVLAMRMTQDEFMNMFDGESSKKTSATSFDRKNKKMGKAKEKPIEVRITSGDLSKGKIGAIDIEIKQGGSRPNPKAIPRLKIWNTNPGGFCVDDMRKKKPAKRIVIVTPGEKDIGTLAELLSKPEAEQRRKINEVERELKVEETLIRLATKCASATEVSVTAMQPKKEVKALEAPERQESVNKVADKITDGIVQDEDRSRVLANWMARKCYVCGKQDKTKKCGRCEGVDYCSKACQVKDWPDHKYVCGLIREEREAAAAK